MIIGESVYFQLGVIPLAIEIANKVGHCVLVFEEINSLTPYMQKILNGLLDWRHGVYVPELKRHYRLKDGAKLLVVGTMNPSTYGGTFELNEDLRSRFASLYFDYPDEDEEAEILEKIIEDIDTVFDKIKRLLTEGNL